MGIGKWHKSVELATQGDTKGKHLKHPWKTQANKRSQRKQRHTVAEGRRARVAAFTAVVCLHETMAKFWGTELNRSAGHV